ncbi:ANTAR domain-containing protein [Streptomyces luteogriseus]|uniref:ANTAR domain-containing protein n=1 Tax=Streptomyces luteogriseus TaxID=68233 RepID=UPI00371F7BE3
MPAVAVVPPPEVTPPGRQGREDRSAIVADGRTGDDGSVVTRRGFVIDVTESLLPRPRLAGSDVASARVSRQDIDLARGILMARYGVYADVALRLLRRRSQDTTARSGTWPGDSWQRPPHRRKGHGRQDLSRLVGSVLYARETD